MFHNHCYKIIYPKRIHGNESKNHRAILHLCVYPNDAQVNPKRILGQLHGTELARFPKGLDPMV